MTKDLVKNSCFLECAERVGAVGGHSSPSSLTLHSQKQIVYWSPLDHCKLWSVLTAVGHILCDLPHKAFRDGTRSRLYYLAVSHPPEILLVVRT